MESEIKPIFVCPFCGESLVKDPTLPDWEWKEIEILSNQVTQDYRLLSNVRAKCWNCQADVGQYIKSVVENTSDLMQEIFGHYIPNIFPDMYHVLSDLQKAIDTLPKTKSALQYADALSLRFGLKDGRKRKLEEVGRPYGLSKERTRQIIDKAFRMIRHPSRSIKLHEILRPGEGRLLRENIIELRRRNTELLRELIDTQAKLTAAIQALEVKEVYFDFRKLDTPIDNLDLKKSLKNRFGRMGWHTVGRIVSTNPSELFRLYRFGSESFRQLVEALEKIGVTPSLFWGEGLERYYPRSKKGNEK